MVDKAQLSRDFCDFIRFWCVLPLPHSHSPLSQEVPNNPDKEGQSQNFKLRPLSLIKNLMSLKIKEVWASKVIDHELLGWISVPGGRRIILLASMFGPILGSIQPPIQQVLGTVSFGVKWSECEADDSLPFHAEFKNTWRFTSNYTLSWHGIFFLGIILLLLDSKFNWETIFWK